jgi:hypothetical protein
MDGPPDSKAERIIAEERWDDAVEMCLAEDTDHAEKRKLIYGLAAADRFPELGAVAKENCWSVVDSLIAQDSAEHPESRRAAMELATRYGELNKDDQLAKIAASQRDAGEFRDVIDTADRISDDKDELQRAAYKDAFHGALRAIGEAGHKVWVKKPRKQGFQILIDHPDHGSAKNPKISGNARRAMKYDEKDKAQGNRKWRDLAVKAVGLFEQHTKERPVV